MSMEQQKWENRESRRLRSAVVTAADGKKLDIRVGTKFAEVFGNYLFDEMAFMEVTDDPVVTKYSDSEFFVAWKAKDRATGEVVSYGVNTANEGYGPQIYGMASERVRKHLKREREMRKDSAKERKQSGAVRARTVLKLETRRQNDTRVLVNVKTGKQRVLTRKNDLLIEDKDIDFAGIFRGSVMGKDIDRKEALEQKHVDYGIELVEHDAEGYGMLMWTYRKEKYYFDYEDLKGSDFYLKVYCLVNPDLEIAVPFSSDHNFEYMKRKVKSDFTE